MFRFASLCIPCHYSPSSSSHKRSWRNSQRNMIIEGLWIMITTLVTCLKRPISLKGSPSQLIETADCTLEGKVESEKQLSDGHKVDPGGFDAGRW